MTVEQDLSGVAPRGGTLLSIGVFDGVHAGHRYLLQKLQQRAAEKELLSGVVTFNPHPQSVLNPQEQLPWLSSLEDRVTTLKELGIHVVAVLAFTPELAQLSAQRFISLLKTHLKMRGIMAGQDFALGRGGEGNVQLLHHLGDRMNFTVEVIPPYAVNGEVVSSTLIRRTLSAGDMRRVERLMGRRFYLNGKVTTSDKRGRLLGFPTANLDTSQQQALPGNGTYATITQVDRKRYASATNIGNRPTFGEGPTFDRREGMDSFTPRRMPGEGQPMVETYLLNYEGDLYGKQIRVEFVQKLRNEQRFPSAQELKAQIEKDVRDVETLLAGDLL